MHAVAAKPIHVGPLIMSAVINRHVLLAAPSLALVYACMSLGLGSALELPAGEGDALLIVTHLRKPMRFLVLALAEELATAAAAAAAEPGPSAPSMVLLLAVYGKDGGLGAKNDIGLPIAVGNAISCCGQGGASLSELDFRSAGRAASMVLRCFDF
jgi:hypothetical protein